MFKKLDKTTEIRAIAFFLAPIAWLFIGYWMTYFGLKVIFNDFEGTTNAVYDIAGKAVAIALAIYSFLFNKRNLQKNQSYRGLAEVSLKFLAVILGILMLMSIGFFTTLALYESLFPTPDANSSFINYLKVIALTPTFVKFFAFIPAIAIGYFSYSFIDNVVSRQKGAFTLSKLMSQIGLIAGGGLLSLIFGYSIAAGYYQISSLSGCLAFALIFGLIGATIFSQIFYFSQSENKSFIPTPIRATGDSIDMM